MVIKSTPNKKQVVLTEEDRALVAKHDELARQVFEGLDQLHVRLCELQQVKQQISGMEKEKVLLIEESVAVAMLNTTTIHGQIISMLKSIVSLQYGRANWETAGMQVHDWGDEWQMKKATDR